MKKAKTIIIKNPTLRSIRDNLRKILILECVAREEEISARMKKLQLSKEGSLRSLSVTKERKISKLNVQLRDYMSLMRNSICFCRMCHSSDKDMSYNPKFKEWYCIECNKEVDLIDFNKCIG